MHAIADTFRRDGCAVAHGVIGREVCERLCELCEPLLSQSENLRPGVRRVLLKQPAIADVLAHTAAPEIARAVAGEGAVVVRSILFDKSPGANWLVPWHQDATIAVQERVEAEGFGPWSVKDGEHHCRPRRDVLDEIVVLRIHLDDCGADNGPLRVVPRSHREGLVSAERLAEFVAEGPEVECSTGAGGVVLMRPHTVHASARALRPVRRRVLHLEFCARALPAPLAWSEAVSLAAGFTGVEKVGR